MFKKILSIILVAVIAVILCSCSSKHVEVTDNNGKQYTVKKGKDSFLETDKKGGLIVYETDKKGKIKQIDGKDVTRVVSFPNYVSYDDIVECQTFRLKIPEGWELQSGQTLKIINKDAQADISFTLRTTDPVDDCIAQIKELYEQWPAAWKTEEVSFDFAKAKVISSSKLIENYLKSYYVFNVYDNTYIVNTSLNVKATKSFDFQSVINELQFKKTKG